MNFTSFIRYFFLGGVLTFGISLFTGNANAAGTKTYLSDASIAVGAHTLRIMAGSRAEMLSVADGKLTVDVKANEIFILRTSSENPVALENNRGESPCNVLPNLENQLLLGGPVVATITPGSTTCATTDRASNATPLITIASPNGGETIKEDTNVQIFWSNAGGTPAGATVAYSVDEGDTWTTLVENKLNDGFFAWSVPKLGSTEKARFRIFGLNQGRIVAVDVSDANIRLSGTLTPPVEEESKQKTFDYDPALTTAHAVSIDEVQGFDESSAVTSSCIAGVRIKSKDNSAVYYCGKDGKRHPFPNEKVHDSWFDTFAGVVTVSDLTLASIPLGANVRYRPGVRMIKIESDPKVYAVAGGAVLRHVATEAVAKALYGEVWNTNIDDISAAFFADYTLGAVIE